MSSSMVGIIIDLISSDGNMRNKTIIYAVH